MVSSPIPRSPDRPAPGPLRIARIPLAQLVPGPANARLHNSANLEAIKASLPRFGQAEPLVRTGRIIAGHGRLEAIRALRWAEADVVELPVENIDATALRIALNRTSELAEWDDGALAKLLEQLRAEDALDGVGYSSADLDALIDELSDGQPTTLEDPGPEPPPETPISERGDLWLLGEHRLLCGDSPSVNSTMKYAQLDAARLRSILAAPR